MLAIAVFVAACASAPVSGPPMRIGDPLPGLTSAELARFNAGKAVFQRTFDAAHGLGPLFNSTSCAECHEQPVVGGIGKGEVGGDDTEVHASKFTNNQCNELTQQGGGVIRLRSLPTLILVDVQRQRCSASVSLTPFRTPRSSRGWGVQAAVRPACPMAVLGALAGRPRTPR